MIKKTITVSLRLEASRGLYAENCFYLLSSCMEQVGKLGGGVVPQSQRLPAFAQNLVNFF